MDQAPPKSFENFYSVTHVPSWQLREYTDKIDSRSKDSNDQFSLFRSWFLTWKALVYSSAGIVVYTNQCIFLIYPMQNIKPLCQLIL